MCRVGEDLLPLGNWFPWQKRTRWICVEIFTISAELKLAQTPQTPVSPSLQRPSGWGGIEVQLGLVPIINLSSGLCQEVSGDEAT